MAHKAAGRLKLTKIVAARGQLECAIRLWFCDADPVSVHTLAIAAQRIIQDVAAHRGIKTGIIHDIAPHLQKEFRNEMRKPANFFKHADNDPDGTIEFEPLANFFAIYEAVEGYHALHGKRTELMGIFMVRFWTSRPQYYDPKFLRVLNESLPVKHLGTLRKKEFIQFFGIDIFKF